MDPDCDQQMTFLSTLKPVASSYYSVGTHEPPRNKTSSLLPVKNFPLFAGIQRKAHASGVRRFMELLDSNSLESLRLETLKQSQDSFTKFTLIVQEGLQRLYLASDVSDVGDEVSTKFVQHLNVMNQLDREKVIYEIELLDRFTQKLEHEQLRQTSAEKPKIDDDPGLIGVSIPLAIMKAIRHLTTYLNNTVRSCNIKSIAPTICFTQGGEEVPSTPNSGFATHFQTRNLSAKFVLKLETITT